MNFVGRPEAVFVRYHAMVSQKAINSDVGRFGFWVAAFYGKRSESTAPRVSPLAWVSF
jgi:hypothetical protein